MYNIFYRSFFNLGTPHPLPGLGPCDEDFLGKILVVKDILGEILVVEDFLGDLVNSL